MNTRCLLHIGALFASAASCARVDTTSDSWHISRALLPPIYRVLGRSGGADAGHLDDEIRAFDQRAPCLVDLEHGCKREPLGASQGGSAAGHLLSVPAASLDVLCRQEGLVTAETAIIRVDYEEEQEGHPLDFGQDDLVIGGVAFRLLTVVVGRPNGDASFLLARMRPSPATLAAEDAPHSLGAFERFEGGRIVSFSTDHVEGCAASFNYVRHDLVYFGASADSAPSASLDETAAEHLAPPPAVKDDEPRPVEEAGQGGDQSLEGARSPAVPPPASRPASSQEKRAGQGGSKSDAKALPRSRRALAGPAASLLSCRPGPSGSRGGVPPSSGMQRPPSATREGAHAGKTMVGKEAESSTVVLGKGAEGRSLPPGVSRRPPWEAADGGRRPWWAFLFDTSSVVPYVAALVLAFLTAMGTVFIVHLAGAARRRRRVENKDIYCSGRGHIYARAYLV